MAQQPFSLPVYSNAAQSSDTIVGFAVQDRNGTHVGYLEELLCEESVRWDEPATWQEALGIVNTGGLLGREHIVMPLDTCRQIDPERRVLRINCQKESFEGDVRIAA
jgi:hypothetical protein